MMLLTVDKANFSDFRVVPAQGRFPAKHQIKVATSGCNDFYLSSESLDMSAFPLLEPVQLSLSVNRVGGGKGFFVMQTEQVTVAPFVASKVKA